MQQGARTRFEVNEPQRGCMSLVLLTLRQGDFDLQAGIRVTRVSVTRVSRQSDQQGRILNL